MDQVDEGTLGQKWLIMIWSILAICYFSLVVRDAWNWFVVPTFAMPLALYKQVFLLCWVRTLFQKMDTKKTSFEHDKRVLSLWSWRMAIVHGLFWWFTP